MAGTITGSKPGATIRSPSTALSTRDRRSDDAVAEQAAPRRLVTSTVVVPSTPGARSRNWRGTSASNAMMPPSPRLSALHQHADILEGDDQQAATRRSNDTQPRTFAGHRRHAVRSCQAFLQRVGGLVAMSPNTMPIAPTTTPRRSD